MKHILALFLMALAGIGVTLYVVWQSDQPATVKSVGLPAFTPPFAHYVAGVGLVEAKTGNVRVGTPVSGIITQIYVKAGDTVDTGTPLFKVDDRSLQLQLPRAQARLKEAGVACTIAQHHADTARRLMQAKTGAAISETSYRDSEDALLQANAALEVANTEVKQLQADSERYVVRALVSGTILQLRMQVGEYAEAISTTEPLLVMGDADRQLRISVNEQDTQRLKPGAAAVAYVRGHPEWKVGVQYAYIEPYIVPKTVLTGVSTERADSRVLQLVYSIQPTSFPLYVGQQLDVFIQTPEALPATVGMEP